MEFRNLTPFSTLQYTMLDAQDVEHYVIAMKVGFRLERTHEGSFITRIMDNPSMPLCMLDEYAGEINHSQVLQESDLAPFKPRCDVIVNGTAYAPAGSTTTEMMVGLKLLTNENHVLLDKHLCITGDHFFNRHSVSGQWSLTAETPFTSLPLDYQYAYGGECKIGKESEAAKFVPEKYHLTEQQQAEHPEADNPPLAHSACMSNPRGRGYVTLWYQQATQTSKIPAPNITDPNAPFTLTSFLASLDPHADLTVAEYQPAGLGILARSWQPRLKKAGTYDRQWLDTRHPRLPTDFDFGYWNAAPPDQQIPYPPPGIRLELKGLHPRGDIQIQLPPHRAAVLLRMTDGTLIPQLMHADTLIVDTEKLTVALTWRYLIKADAPLRVIEARYMTDIVQGEN
ncbi:MAG TPA: DUF2169 domain-containing protein [Scandinavium sp.]|jgi:hypothetical protein|uniref:DUF2169 family type VI secretion system accessory protein n=1 Tax=Scandinavium sp. TaxID=2830653 RepID=UPI002E2F432B|nr:DUF2169 domain-containing protein [Scandinavium sp.]HEX4504038.1 DUF2169 domain-containing protein [Scandinavium sp.]